MHTAIDSKVVLCCICMLCLDCQNVSSYTMQMVLDVRHLHPLAWRLQVVDFAKFREIADEALFCGQMATRTSAHEWILIQKRVQHVLAVLCHVEYLASRERGREREREMLLTSASCPWQAFGKLIT